MRVNEARAPVILYRWGALALSVAALWGCGARDNADRDAEGRRSAERGAQEAEDGAFSVERVGALAAVIGGVSAEIEGTLDQANPELSFPDGSCVRAEETSDTITTYTLTNCGGAFGQLSASGTLTAELVVDMLPVIEYTIASQDLSLNGEAASIEATVTYNTASSQVEIVTASAGPRRMGMTTLSLSAQGQGCATLSGDWVTTSPGGTEAQVSLSMVDLCDGQCLPASGSASAQLSEGPLSEDITVSMTFTGMNTMQWSANEETGEWMASCMRPSQ